MMFVGLVIVGSVDGIGVSVLFNNLLGIVVDVNENVYVVDYSNNMICKIMLVGVVIILVGIIIVGSNNGVVVFVIFNGLLGIVFFLFGMLYVVEWFNSDIW